jgi:fructokinase
MTSRVRFDVIAFGEILWDVFEIAPNTFRREIGGAPANLAIGLARVGAKSAVVGGVSRDAFGDALVARITTSGVDTSHIARLPERTGLAFVSRDARGEPSFLFYRHETADMRIAPKHVTHLPAARFAVVGTSTLLGEPRASATRAFVRHASRSGAALVVDLNVRAHLWKSPRVMRSRIAELAREASLVKASRADLDALGGRQFLVKNATRATWILTDGKHAAHAIGAHGEIALPALRAHCVDATGAGDAFLAGVLAVLSARGASPSAPAWRDAAVFSDALRVGHMLGKKVVSKVGAVTGLVGLESAKRMIRGKS